MRLFLKTISYGVIHIIIATAVAFTLTGNLAVALGIGLLEPIVQTFVFSIHDWLWEHNVTLEKMSTHNHINLKGA